MAPPSRSAAYRRAYRAKHGRRSRAKGTRVEIEYLEDFITDIAPKMTQVGIDIKRPVIRQMLFDAIKSNGRSRSRGNVKKTTDIGKGLLSSLSSSHTFFRKNGTRFRANIYFKQFVEVNGNKVYQGNKAGWLNYGTDERHTDYDKFRGKVIPANFVAKASHFIDNKVVAAMQAVLDEELKNYQE